jgi:iron complex outermembrane receptor protein
MKRPLAFLTLLAIASAASAQNAASLSEQDYLSDMPIVLSVSRLPQRLDETPGAVTILDRDMIRRSGARDVADLLRLVPGFQTSTSFEGDAPQASYHGTFSSYSARIQILVDGRSAYSTYMFGSVAPGMMSVALEDIERIEVLRGSNSAAYGARAMLGVVNIVTQHTSDTQGTQAKLAKGENGVRDAQAALGWATDHASYRLGMDTRADEGLTGANGHNFVRRVNFRSDWRASPTDNVQLRVGSMGIDAGSGNALKDSIHDKFFESSFAQVDWHRNLGVDEDVTFMLSHTQEAYRDVVPIFLRQYVPVSMLLSANDSINLDFSGNASNDTITVQHTFRSGEGLRVVWGGEWRREQVTSLPVYNTSTAFVTDFKRLFGNAEWRIKPNVLLNAGLMAEHSTDSGASLAPRLMFNWHVVPGQTLRAGIARAYRPPSVLEKYSDTRYTYSNMLLQVTSLSRGNVQPESVLTRELGYLADFPKWGAKLDVRAFEERVSNFVGYVNYTLPVGTSLLASAPKDYVNQEEFKVHGFEYQWAWQPWRGSKLAFNQSYTNITFTKPQVDLGVPLYAPELVSTLFLTQELPGGFEASVSHQDANAVSLPQSGRNKQAMTRTDVRLSKALRWGSKKGELAVVVQNLGSPYQDFNELFTFQRRAFVTLRLDN